MAKVKYIEFEIYDINKKTQEITPRKIKVNENFKVQVGCGKICPIIKHEKANKTEICCDSARQCCFFCFEDSCPIKDIYKNVIKHFGSLMDDSDEDDSTTNDDEDPEFIEN